MEHDIDQPFWRKPLRTLTDRQWEAVCDGCGRCCLNKLINDEGEVFFTRAACHWLDIEQCRCRDYANRKINKPDCLQLRKDFLQVLPLLPPSCSYRLLWQGLELPVWHPLLGGDVHAAGVSVRDLAVDERLCDAPLESQIIDFVDDIE